MLQNFISSYEPVFRNRPCDVKCSLLTEFPDWQGDIFSTHTSCTITGLVWACQPNGDIFAFTSDRQTCACIESPKKQNKNVMFTCMSVCFDALWGLTDSGEVYIRTGMSSLEPRGSDWVQLDLSQLGKVADQIKTSCPSCHSLTYTPHK